MTEDKILHIKEHIEIYARREPQARRITEILWEAVKELEQYEKMKCCENCKHHRFMGNELDCKIGWCEKEEKWKLYESK